MKEDILVAELLKVYVFLNLFLYFHTFRNEQATHDIFIVIIIIGIGSGFNGSKQQQY